ncbi:hypothetical protein GCM10010452_57550 [Crossiella cryophila]
MEDGRMPGWGLQERQKNEERPMKVACPGGKGFPMGAGSPDLPPPWFQGAAR